MACTFVNLHLHTEIGSPLDGFARIPDIIKRSQELNYDSIAVTDHGSMSGVLPLYNEGKSKGIRVIPGIETYCVNDRTVRVKGEHNLHLVLLAKNKEGYKNLLRLNMEGYKTGSIKVYDRVIPRVDFSLLEQYGKGLIATSACFLPSTRILTQNGIKQFSDLDQSEYVINLNGHWVRYQNITTRLFQGDIYDFNKKQDWCTSDHQFLIIDRVQKTFYNKKIRKTKRVFQNKRWEKAENLKVGQYCLLARPKLREGVSVLKILEKDYGKYSSRLKKINTEYTVTQDLMYLFGLYLAEGSCHKGIVIFTLHKKEMIIAEKIIQLHKQIFNLEGKIVNHLTSDNCIEVRLSSVILEDFYCAHAGKGALKKKLSNELMACNYFEFLIQGLFIGDGSMSTIQDGRNANWNWDVFTWATSSKELFGQIYIKMCELGIKGTYWTQYPKTSTNLAYYWTTRGNNARMIQRFLKDEDQHIVPVLTKGMRSGILITIDEIEYFATRIDKIEKKAYSGQVYCLSVEEENSFSLSDSTVHNCLVGTIPYLLGQDKFKEAAELAERYKGVFDRFYLEVQPSYLIGPDQVKMNRKILELSKQINIPIVVTLDNHYVYAEDREYHHVLLAVQSKKTIFDENRLFFESNPLLSEEEILKEFPMEIIKNTREVADQCEPAKYLDNDRTYKIPEFPIPKDDIEFSEWEKSERGKKSEEASKNIRYCRFKTDKGWIKKLKNKSNELKQIYQDRIIEERKVIEDMNFTDYFLIVADMLEECDRRGIPRGVGRGSSGGSLLAYLLDITKVDPIQYGLLFSRFLNKDRISMPDIDSDICQSRRDEIKQYLVDKYGQDKVAGIATFGTMKVRAAVKDVVRSLDLGGNKSDSFRLADKISKSITSENPEVSFQEAYDESKEFRDYCDTPLQYPKGAKLKDCLIKFEGITRQMGIHAAGVIISTESLPETLPMVVQNGIIATAYDGPTLEKAGYLKLDILGLKALDTIDMAVKNVEKVYNEKITGYPVNSIEFDSKDLNAEKKFNNAYAIEENLNKKRAAKTFRLYRTGRTSACFQTSGSGMQNLLKQVRPNEIEDIAAVLALFRPGPLKSGMTEEYAKRKNGLSSVEYLHPDLEPILKNTYSVVTYQEQVMRIATDIAGFTMSEADTLRKACGKKDVKLMNAQETKFKEGGVRKGYTKELIDELWQLIVKFAEYGFNKAHSIAYALTSYKMAFLKANFPSAFWAAALSSESDEEKRNSLIMEIQQSLHLKNSIKLLAADINVSGLNYVCISPSEIRRDLVSLKGIGEAAVEEIISKRPFKSFIDFLDRAETRKINSRVVRILIRAGVFSSLESFSRKFLEYTFESCRDAMHKYKKKNKVTTIQNTDFAFDWNKTLDEIISKEKSEKPTFVYGETEWSEEQIRDFEQEIYGMMISSHPLDACMKDFDQFKKTNTHVITLDKDFDDLEDGQIVFVMVYIKGKKSDHPYKKDPSKKIRNFFVEDKYGNAELSIFDDEYKRHEKDFKVGNIVQISTKVSKKYGIGKRLTFCDIRQGKKIVSGIFKCFLTRKVK